MSIPPAETRYEKLPPVLQKICREEINEVPENVNAHLASFRRWIASMPHLKCPIYDDFLLMFLRVAKFSHKKAQQRLDNFCTVRASKSRGYTEVFDFRPIDDPVVDLALQYGYAVQVGMTAKGRFIFIERASKEYDLKQVSLMDIMKCALMMTDMVICHPAIQIGGICGIVDWSTFGIKFVSAWLNPKLVKMFMTIMQDTMPMRHQSILLYREPKIFHIVLNIMEHFMKEKLKKKLIRIGDDASKIPELLDYCENLPIEYGGKHITADELRLKIAEDLRNFYAKHNGRSPFADIQVDETKRPAETLKYLNVYSDYKGDTSVMGTEGTVTRLET